MKKENLLKKHNGQLIPYEDEDIKVFNLINEGDFVSFATHDVRSILYHRRFFALLAKVLEHVPEHINTYFDQDLKANAIRYTSVDSLLIELKLQMQLYDLHITLGGKSIYVPRSVNFKSMGQKKFKKFVEDAQVVILKRFIPDVTPETFTKEFLNLMFD